MSVISVSTLEDAGVLQTPGVRLVLWRRALEARIGAWLDSLPAERLPHGRVLISPEEAGPALHSLGAAAGTPGGPEWRWLVDDIAGMVAVFARVGGDRRVDLRLEAISHDACWRFHCDMVPFRLVTTYRGPGTQWVDPVRSEAALRDQRAYAGPLEVLHPGHVALFKGARAAEGGIVHRSPPMDGTGRTRLFLCLNLPSEVSPRPWADR